MPLSKREALDALNAADEDEVQDALAHLAVIAIKGEGASAHECLDLLTDVIAEEYAT